MADRIKLRRDSYDNWNNPTIDPILADGEPGFDKDRKRIKVGDGLSKWSELEFLHGEPEGWVNVKDFGAKGDGVTDDTAAIQAAVIASVGKVLYINNHHRVSEAGITVPSNSHIIFGPEGKLSLLPHNATSYHF